MSQLYVYEPWPNAVDTLGLCGPLTPTSAQYAFERNGRMELSISHPIDAVGKWAQLTNGRLIKAEVPMRTTPIMLDVSGYAPTIDEWEVVADATRVNRAVYAAIPNTSATEYTVRLATLDPGERVCVVQTKFDGDWSEVVWPRGRGWMRTEALEFVATTNVSAARGDIESLVPSPRTRPQLFRIYSTIVSGDGVEVKAWHVSYDLLGARVSYPAQEGAGLAAVVSSLLFLVWWSDLGKHAAVDFWTDDRTATADVSGWENVSPVEALIAPSNSVAAYWNRTILRDNWTYTLLLDPYYDSGYRIEYGVNMLGTKLELDTTEVVSALIPVGQTSKGKSLTIPDGTYTVDGVATEVSYGIVRSENDNYPVPHAAPLDLKETVKASGTGESALNAAYAKLIRAARKKFADEHCDVPKAKLTVNFLQLGSAWEYAQYREMDRLFPLDSAHIRSAPIGIDMTANVISGTWDCLLDRYEDIQLDTPRANSARSRLAPWQVPGLASLAASLGTLSDLV